MNNMKRGLKNLWRAFKEFSNQKTRETKTKEVAMFFFSIRFLFLNLFLFFSFSSGAIYNLKTNTGGLPKEAEKKHWLLVSQGCHSCSEVLTELKKFCSDKKPSPSKIGFFAIGKSSEALLKKLEDFKADYEIFSGSSNEFYQTYQLLASPSLKIKAKEKTVVGKSKILEVLKKDSDFCSA